MTIGCCSLLDLMSFLNCLNSSPFINGKTLAMGWNSNSCCLGGSCLVSCLGGSCRLRKSGIGPASPAGLLVSVEVMTPSHQPSAGAQLRIHCGAIGLSRRSSQVLVERLALSFDRAWLHGGCQRIGRPLFDLASS